MATDRRIKVSGLAFILFCFSLFLTAYSSRNAGVASIGTAAISEIQRPVQTVLVTTFSAIGSVWESYIGLVGLRDRYNELERRYQNLEHDRAQMLELQEENARLRELLSAGEPIASSMLASRVIAFDPSNWIQAITIDKGSSDGVQVGMAAITYEGVVGQVSAVGLTSAKVLLLTDHSSGVEAVLQGSRIRGIVEGAGRRSLRWRFVLEEDEVKPGDRLVTSGMDGIYPPGLFIGRVANVERNTAGMFQQIDVSPAVNMAKLEEVLLIKNTRTTEKIEATRKKK